jgi:hypothetical protein
MWKEASAFMFKTKGLNTEAAGFSEMLVTTYQTSVHCVSSEDNLKQGIYSYLSLRLYRQETRGQKIPNRIRQ